LVAARRVAWSCKGRGPELELGAGFRVLGVVDGWQGVGVGVSVVLIRVHVAYCVALFFWLFRLDRSSATKCRVGSAVAVACIIERRQVSWLERAWVERLSLGRFAPNLIQTRGGPVDLSVLPKSRPTPA
jgi:hypothetical protein